MTKSQPDNGATIHRPRRSRAQWQVLVNQAEQSALSIAENQRPACEVLAAASMIAYLGHKDGGTIKQLRHAILGMMDAGEQRQRLTKAGAERVDGQGAQHAMLAMQAAVSTRYEV